MANKHYVTKNQAAKMLGIGAKGIVKVCEKNGIKLHVIPYHRITFYRRDAIERLVKAAGMYPVGRGN